MSAKRTPLPAVQPPMAPGMSARALTLLLLAACSSPMAVPPAGDAAADADASSADRTDGPNADTDPGPTPEQWAVCPDNIRDLGYAVRSCSYVSGAFGLEHPARVASVEPTWIADGTEGNRAITIEEAIARGAQRGNAGSIALQHCDLRLFPPACRCDCTGQQFDVRRCPGFENGRMYLGEQLNLIGMLAARTGHCPRL